MQWTDEETINVLLNSSCFPSVAMNDDGWSVHQCINLRTCLESLPAYSGSDLYEFRFRWIEFVERDDFWIDEFILMTGLQNVGGEHFLYIQ